MRGWFGGEGLLDGLEGGAEGRARLELGYN